MIPNANNCAPEKIAIIEERNVNPGSTIPTVMYLNKTYANTARPKNINANPIRVVNLKGKVVKPVMRFNECLIRFIN
jgi:hypothetical protein